MLTGFDKESVSVDEVALRSTLEEQLLLEEPEGVVTALYKLELTFQTFAKDRDYGLTLLKRTIGLGAEAATYFNLLLEKSPTLRSICQTFAGQLIIDCAHNNKPTCLKCILQMDIQPAQLIENNNQALKSASSNGYIRIVELLLKYPIVQVLAGDHHNQALRFAVENKHWPVVKLLCEIPIVRSHLDAFENLFVKMAANNDDLRSLKTLVSAGATTQELITEHPDIEANIEMHRLINFINIYNAYESNITKVSREALESCLQGAMGDSSMSLEALKGMDSDTQELVFSQLPWMNRKLAKQFRESALTLAQNNNTAEPLKMQNLLK